MTEHATPLAALKAFESARKQFGLQFDANSVILQAWMNWPTPQWIQVPGDGMLAVNHAYTRFYGIAEDSYPGTRNSKWWDSQESGQYDDNDQRAIREGAIYVVERMFNRVLDRPEDLLCLKSPMMLEDGRDAVVGEVVVERSPLRLWGGPAGGLRAV